jgi:heme exporter protein C
MRLNKYDRAAAGAVALMLVALAAIFFYAPTDWLQGPVQRIFYLHVSSAIAAYGAFTVVLLGGLVFLRNESYAADRWARAGATVGVIFTTVTLVMGSLWAKKVWGQFWVWDARLTSTLVLWIIYAGYLLVRRLAEPGRQAARIGALVGIFGFVDVPVVHFSVTWWVTQHPGTIVENDALPPEMLATFLFTMLCTIVFAAVLVVIRYQIETLRDAKQVLVQPAKVVPAHQPEPVQ